MSVPQNVEGKIGTHTLAGGTTVTGGLRPDITPAQVVSFVPIAAELLHAFGVYSLSQAQQDSLGKMVTWAIALVGADAVLRVGRNLAKRL